MKITHVLLRQHIGRHFKRHWWVQSKITIKPSVVEEELKKRNIPIYKGENILKKETKPEKIEIIGLKPEPVKRDRTHPNWNDRICYTLRDDNVLLEGLTQAKVITNTVEVQEGLPQSLDLNQSIKGINRRVKEIILSSHLFDAEQKKLPKIKDPLRPSFNFPRTHGITQERRYTLLISKLLQLIEVLVEPEVVRNKAIFNDLYFTYPFEKYNDLILFELSGDTLLTSSQPLKRIHGDNTSYINLPDIQPMKETITLNKEHIYRLQNCYPIDLTIPKCHPQTLFVHYNPNEVKNAYEEEVTENQIYGRSLLKSFTVAASYAKQLYGESTKDLPKPVTLQCVHTDGRLFHFGILQLNTLDLTNVTGMKNIWYQTERLPLFENCSYVQGRPILEGYNNEVIRHLLAFYNNI
ncbi:mitochondrial ribosomal protein l37 [Holotrichia oblita]|uniref:Mitochondrial ribosomal protein l37 n=1 Tax=Holotrichia oblita TaxID=644536 RepID=A0ACB9TK67_HOLOL|nr:mitochondrial ribosomal protein l37 [Holotrichia oblita]